MAHQRVETGNGIEFLWIHFLTAPTKAKHFYHAHFHIIFCEQCDSLILI